MKLGGKWDMRHGRETILGIIDKRMPCLLNPLHSPTFHHTIHFIFSKKSTSKHSRFYITSFTFYITSFTVYYYSNKKALQNKIFHFFISLYQSLFSFLFFFKCEQYHRGWCCLPNTLIEWMVCHSKNLKIS
jgi:hypothetical protein